MIRQSAGSVRRWLTPLAALAAIGATGAIVGDSVRAQSSSAPVAEAASGSNWTLAKHRELVEIFRARIDPTEADNWTMPRTPWGEPDLQGFWTSDSVHGVPRERPEQFGLRAFLNETELAEREAREEQTRQHAASASSPNTNQRDRFWRGNVTFGMTSMIVDPPDGRIPALTPVAAVKPVIRGTWADAPHLHQGPEDFTNYDRCISRGVVGSILPVSYGNGNLILQTPGEVVISYEMVHDTRIVPVDGRPHLGPNLRQHLGDPRGRWEGDTLIVETTNLTGDTSIGGNGNGLRHSAAMRLTERLTRLSEHYLLYEVTMDDPETYAAPWTMVLPLVSPPGFMTLPYECHEANGAVSYSLSGAREYDRAVEEARAKGLPPPVPAPTELPSRDE